MNSLQSGETQPSMETKSVLHGDKGKAEQIFANWVFIVPFVSSIHRTVEDKHSENVDR